MAQEKGPKIKTKVNEAKKVFEDGDYEGCIAILS